MYPNHNTKFPSSTEQHITHTHTQTHSVLRSVSLFSERLSPITVNAHKLCVVFTIQSTVQKF